MARLTWQNVNAPSFAGIGDNYRVMSQLLGNATRSGMDIIDTVRNTNAEAADRAILQRMVGAQDPTTYDPNAIIGGDGSRASLDTLRGVGDYAGTLLNRAVTGENLNQTRYANQRTQQGNALMDAAGDATRQFAIATRNNDQATANRLLQSNPQLANLRPDQLMGLIGEGDTLANSNLSRTRTGQLIDQSTHNFGRQIRGEGITDQTAAARAELARTASDPQHYEQLLWQYAQENNLAPEAVNTLFQGPSGGSAGGGAITSALSSPASTAPIGSSGAVFAEPQRAVATTLQSAGISEPVIAGIMGNLHVEGGYDGATGDGGSAAGIAQWRGPRREAFRARYGVDPSRAPHAQQAEFLVWELTTPEGRRSAGITEERANQILNAGTPEEAARLFDQHYERSDGQHRDRRVAAANDFSTTFRQSLNQQLQVPDARTDILRANTVANAGSLNQRLADLEGQPDQPISALTKGLQEAGYAGYTQGQLADEIRAVASEAKVTNAQAALIMQESLTDRSWFMRGLRNIPWVGGSVAENTFDRDRNIQAARDFREGGLSTVSQNRERALVDTQLGQLQQRQTQIDAQIQNAFQRFQATQAPEHLERIRQLQSQKALLRAATDTVTGEQASTQEWTSADLQAAARRAAQLEAQTTASSPEAVRARQELLLRQASQSGQVLDDFFVRSVR